jgi:hypothetical protein
MGYRQKAEPVEGVSKGHLFFFINVHSFCSSKKKRTKEKGRGNGVNFLQPLQLPST